MSSSQQAGEAANAGGGRAVYQTLEVDQKIWVPAPKNHPDIYQLAVILAVDEIAITARTIADGRLETIDLSQQQPMLANHNVQADMTALHYIHEPGILYNLEQRSLQTEPYTFLGGVLAAVNPLRSVTNPSNVGTRAVLTGPPHPYCVAESSFQQMTFQGSRELFSMEKGQPGSLKRASQSIVVSGESGAGKTESSKMVLQHLVSRQALKQTAAGGGDMMNGLDARLLGTNPILEAFGNASTLRNPNSSRFGKMLRLHFNPPPTSQGTDEEWTLRGATVQSYLLERSRVTAHEQGERGYHILYYVIAGNAAKLDPSMEGLGLEQGSNSYRYTTPAHPKYDQKWDEKFVRELVDAMGAVGFSKEDMRAVWEVVAGICHMGNIEFGEKDTNEGATAFVSNAPVLAMCAKMFGVEPDALAKIFTERRFEVAGTEMMTVRNARAAGFARDAVAKAVYSGLFDWILRRIDIALGGASSNLDQVSTIGVLDIFGFETFAVNGFEQLLINYTNEALQGTFNSQIFIAEAALYLREGLYGSESYMGQPLDNGICIELLQGNAAIKGQEVGLLLTIDNEGRVPDPSDGKMLQRLHTMFGKHACMVAPHPKDKAQVFIIKHYAATVTYTIGAFLEKNNDRLPDDMESTLRKTTQRVMKEVFEAPAPVAAAAAAPAAKGKAKKPPARSIVHKFQGQIKQLVDDLEMTKCSFIRCVKPNATMQRSDSDPSWFNRQYVKKQLDALNVSQTAEVLRNGFPTRIEYSALVDTYVSCLPERAIRTWKNSSVGPESASSSGNSSAGRDNKSFVRALFYAFDVDQESYKLGLTRVFFKGGKLAELDKIMKTATGGQIPEALVKRFTYYYARVQWRRLACQARCQLRMQQLYERAQTRIRIATVLQSLFRMRKFRKQFVALRAGAVMAQKMWRGKVQRRAYAKLYQENIAEIKRKHAIAQEEARRKMEEAKAKADLEALKELERQAELQRAEEARLEQEERERLERVALQEQQERERIEQALEAQRQEQAMQERAFNANRRMSMMAARQTMVTNLGNGKIAIKPGGKLQAKRIGVAPLPPPPPPPPPLAFVFDDDEDVPPPPPEDNAEDDAPPPPPEETAEMKQKRREERKAYCDRIYREEEKIFNVPIKGKVYVREEVGKGGLMSKVGKNGIMSKVLGKTFFWDSFPYVLEKGKRNWALYFNETRPVEGKFKDVILGPQMRMQRFKGPKDKPYAFEVINDAMNTHFQTMYFAFEHEDTFKQFQRDFEETVRGFQPSVVFEEEVEPERVDPQVILQLNTLLAKKRITQREFDDLLNRAREEAAAKTLEKREELASKLEGLVVHEPLKDAYAEGLCYRKGKLSCGSHGMVRKIDLVTFDEVFVLELELRFHLDKFPDKEVSWHVQHKFNEFADLHAALLQLQLTNDAAKAIPDFPTLQYGPPAKRINVKHSEALCKQVEQWTKRLFANLPVISKSDSEDGEENARAAEEVQMDPNLDPANWRTVRDENDGFYWNNKVTGENRYDEDPVDPELRQRVLNMPPGWEEVFDPETKEQYYYNSLTEETTWVRPEVVKPVAVKQYDLSELLFVDPLVQFFDLAGNIDALVEAVK